MRLTKTFLLFFLLINIVCVIFAAKSISDEGQTSGSKAPDEEDTVEEEEEIKKAEEIEEEEEEDDEEEDIELWICKVAIFDAFKTEIPLSNFFYALLFLNEKRFEGGQYHGYAKAYYLDLLNKILDSAGIQTLISPQEFCQRNYESTETDCTSVIEKICKANDKGTICLEKFYLHWERNRKIRRTPISSRTADLSDEDLLEAISRVSDNPNNISDNDLLNDYINEYTPSPMTIEEFLLEGFKITEESSDYEELKNIFLHDRSYDQLLKYKQRRRDLHRARSLRYGISNVPFNDICEEYDRRCILREQYDDHYAMYFLRTIKFSDIDVSRLQSRHDYCKDFISKFGTIN